MKVFIRFGIYLLILSTQVMAGSDALDKFFDQTKSFSANFSQTITREDGRELEHSNGKLLIHKPGQFYLHYQQPDEQFYICNGKTLWIYDVDLEQVTLQRIDQKLLHSPASFLSNKKQFEKYYWIKESVDYDHPEQDIFDLLPKAEYKDKDQGFFSQIRFIFVQDELLEIRMVDNFSQTTRLVLSDQKRNIRIDNKIFQFTIPENVDVIGTY